MARANPCAAAQHVLQAVLPKNNAPSYKEYLCPVQKEQVMRLREFLLVIVSVVKRLAITRAPSHRRLFINLSRALISAQDQQMHATHARRVLAPYRSLLISYVRSLAKGREALPGSRGRFLRLPLGCRFGKLQFSPLLQFAKLADAPEVKRVEFEALPRTHEEIEQHIKKRFALTKYGVPTAFIRLFKFCLGDYCAYLTSLRRADPVLFVMLLANEFKYARDWAASQPKDLIWVNRGATLGELERLVEIVSFAKRNPQSISQLREAIRLLAKGGTSRKYSANLRKARFLLPHIDQLGYSAESLRALFLGDAGGPPLTPNVSWSSVTRELLHQAAARCAWFANDLPVPVDGFRQPPKRFVRSRKHSAYTYYGIPLDCLLVIGIRDLAKATGSAGGARSINALAAAIHEGVFGPTIDFERLARQSVFYEEIYLREQGHGGSGNRFDPRYWFETYDDEALYGRLWRLFISGSNATSAKSVRYHIRSCLSVIGQLLDPFWRQQMPVNPSEAARVLAQLSCALTPVSMDPIFAALIERAMVERRVPAKFRSEPAQCASQNPADAERYLRRLLNGNTRSAYARFEDVTGRPNHAPVAQLQKPLVTKKTLPRPLRRVAT